MPEGDPIGACCTVQQLGTPMIIACWIAQHVECRCNGKGKQLLWCWFPIWSKHKPCLLTARLLKNALHGVLGRLPSSQQ